MKQALLHLRLPLGAIAPVLFLAAGLLTLGIVESALWKARCGNRVVVSVLLSFASGPLDFRV
jgi:hypothetical protein